MTSQGGYRCHCSGVCFNYLLIYLFICLFIFYQYYITVEGNSSYFMSKTENKYVIVNLYWLNSKAGSGFDQTSKMGISSKKRQLLLKKMKFSITYFFSKCYQIRRKLRIWSHLLKKSVMESFIFCAVNSIKPVLFLCEKFHPAYPAVLNIPLLLPWNTTYTQNK